MESYGGRKAQILSLLEGDSANLSKLLPILFSKVYTINPELNDL